MKINDLAEKLGWKLLAGEDGTDREVEGCYVCDLLSWAMSRAQEDYVWITVMGNVNAIAVAALTDVSAIVLADNAPLDEDAKNRADQQGIAVYTCDDDIYASVVKVYEELKA